MLNKKVLFLASLPGDSSSKDGYINAAEGIRRVLVSLNIKDLKIINLGLPVNPKEFPDHEYDVAYLICNPYIFPQPTFQAHIMPILRMAKKVYMQIVWELNDFPVSWQWMWGYLGIDGFITPSHFLENMIKSKTKKPVFYIPHFIDTSVYKFIDLEKKSKEEKFTVLNIGQWTERKGNEDAVVAFARALGDKPDCQLIMKYSKMSQVEIDPEAVIRSLVKRNCLILNADIFVNEQVNTPDELVALYQKTSVLLFSSRGEGFGLPPAEIMSCGIPVIYTDFSSLPEVCWATGNIPVGFTEDEARGMAHFGYEKGLQYAIPNMSELINALEMKYALWKESKEKYYVDAMDRRQVIEMNYGTESLKEKMLNFIENA